MQLWQERFSLINLKNFIVQKINWQTKDNVSTQLNQRYYKCKPI